MIHVCGLGRARRRCPFVLRRLARISATLVRGLFLLNGFEDFTELCIRPPIEVNDGLFDGCICLNDCEMRIPFWIDRVDDVCERDLWSCYFERLTPLRRPNRHPEGKLSLSTATNTATSLLFRPL